MPSHLEGSIVRQSGATDTGGSSNWKAPGQAAVVSTAAAAGNRGSTPLPPTAIHPPGTSQSTAGGWLAFDFETQLIRPGLQAPPPVCLSVAGSGGRTGFAPTPEAREVFKELLRAGVPLVGHNTPYDLACAFAWWDCTELLIEYLDAGLVLDTWLIERLAEIGGLTPRKGLDLDTVCRAHGLPPVAKDAQLDPAEIPTPALALYRPEWPCGLPPWEPLTKAQQATATLCYPNIRISYGPLLDRPLSWYAPKQIQYSVDDSVATYALFERQWARYIANGRLQLPDLQFMMRKRMWLELCRAWGLRTNPEKLSGLRETVEAELTRLRNAAWDLGVIRPNPKTLSGWSKDLKALREIVTDAYDGKPPMSDKGCVKTAKSVLQQSGDARLEAIALLGEWSTTENLIPKYEQGTVLPIHTKWGMADTTRVTSSKPPVQNLSKDAGIRECFTPRPGFCYVGIDHGGLENATLAQCIASNLGLKRLANFLNDDGTGTDADLHCLVGAEVAGVSYLEAKRLYATKDKEFKVIRNAVKPINFGRPGGAGWKTLKFIAKQIYKLDWTETQTRSYIAAWERAVPDGKAYLDWVSRQPCDAEGRYEVRIGGTTIMRRGTTYCSACNNGFQSLGAVIEGAVGWSMLRERLLGRTPEGQPSPLRYCAMVNFIHDEFIWEVPIGLQTAAAARLEWHMRSVPRPYLPDVRLDAEAVAMAYWSKDAERVVHNGELQIWPLAA